MVKNALGGILLVTGTCVGAGTLALPIATAHLGLFYSVLAFLCCWVFMTGSALLMLEANIRIAHGANLVTMAEISLGFFGKIIAWITYLMLLYALTAAYLNGASGWMIAQVEALSGCNLSLGESAAVLVSIIALIIYAGHTVADWTNRILMLGLGITFLSLITSTAGALSHETLWGHPQKWQWSMFPMLITAFGYHIVIPSLANYLDCSKTLRGIILKGSLLALSIYLIWEVWVLGLLSTDSLVAIGEDQNTTAAMARSLQLLGNTPFIDTLASTFTIFVITTSFIGVTLSLFDFIADGLHICPKTREKRIEITALTFLPPLAFVLLYPAGFLFALSFAGIFVAILLGIFPALMVWQARYRMQTHSSYTFCGGKPLLLTIILFFSAVVGIAVESMFT